MLLSPAKIWFEDIRSANPKLIVVDYQTGEQSILDIIDELSLQIAEIAVIAIVPGNDPLIAQQVMLAGARAFIVHPFTQVNLLSTLRRMRDLEGRQMRSLPTAPASTDYQSPLKTMVVYSPRGGVGCSTIAVNLAISLKEKSKRQVLLLGGKLFFGHLGLMLNLRTNNSIADLIPHAAQLDDALIRDVVVEHISGIHILMEPFNFQVAQGIRPQELFNILAGLKSIYDYIVIDAGSALNENVVTQMDLADRVLLVTTPDLASLHDAKRFIEISRSLDFQPDKILVALNRVGMPGSVKSKDIASALKQEIFIEIPDDGARVQRSINRGVPLTVRYPRSSTSKAINHLAEKLHQQANANTTVRPEAIPNPI